MDDRDVAIGSERLDRCLAEGLLHRAVAVLIFRTNGSVILQQRSTSDLWQPGKWTLSCTGHVKKGEDYSGAAGRELFEELGLRSKLEDRGRHLLPAISDGKLVEREWVGLFTAKDDGVITEDPIELEKVEEVVPSVIRERPDSHPLTEDARILLEDVLWSV